MVGMTLGALLKRHTKSNSLELDMKVNSNWEDVTCPICLEFPHNAVLLKCSSCEKGCQPFVCDTDQTRSNCLDRYRSVYGLSAAAKVSSTTNETSSENAQNPKSPPTCPLCRGDVMGWVVLSEARQQLNLKTRCCEESRCSYVGNFYELQKHTQLKHPNSRPSKIDPSRQLDWENFQQSSDIIDVLSTIHSEVPRGVVFGDYVIEFADDESGDEYEDFHRMRGKWWISCIFSRVLCRDSGNRRRTGERGRRGSGRRRNLRSISNYSYVEDAPARSVDIMAYRLDEIDIEFVRTGSSVAASRRTSSHYRDNHGRRRSHLYDH
ncbi:uncharacterized protein [Typha angustifolia]|uniref:uncharacterized protein n=1 Tax=Typha angustifolia TaxID=59011 RepID=UPI003C2E1E02